MDIQRSIEEFIEEFIVTKLMIGDSVDLYLSSIRLDMGIDKAGIGDLMVVIEEEYGIDTNNILADDDNITTLAEKISQLI